MALFIPFHPPEVIGTVHTVRLFCLTFMWSGCSTLLRHLGGERGRPRGWEKRVGAGWEGKLDEKVCAEKRVIVRQTQDKSLEEGGQ